MKEKILEIIRTHIEEYNNSPIGNTNISLKEMFNAGTCAEKITTHIMEFIEWLAFGRHPFVAWFDEDGHYYTDELTSRRWSIIDLYKHWINNKNHDDK